MNRWRSLGVADQYGRRVVVTGANTGLGYQAALALAGAGAEVVLAVRDLDRGQAAAQRIRDRLDDAQLRVSYLDLADLASVRDFVAMQLSTGSLDLLINNAGLMLTPSRVRTRDGFERQMG
ncbi:MAG: SDR family NAD(P)-dependent oxidoreductase, partial [Nakamurella sp.]